MTLITATTRLARELLEAHDREQIAAGLSTWPTPHILPFDAWLTELWEEWLYSGGADGELRLLRRVEERTIWEDIVRSEADNVLLEVPATAEAALDSWNLLCQWRLPLDDPEWNDSTDSEVFYRWATQFIRRSRKNGWLPGGELAGFISDRISDGGIRVPCDIEIAGFLELTPAQERLFDALRVSETRVRERPVPDSPGEAVRIGLIDPEREIHSAAGWARRILEIDPEAATPEFRIGIVVANLDRRRSQVERVFSEEFHPRERLRPDLDPRRLFNISLGPKASTYPIIDTALSILETRPQDLLVGVLSRLVRSPFIAGAREELTERGLLDGTLRSFGEPELDLGAVLSLAEKNGGGHGCPKLATQLRAWSEACQTLEPTQLPSDWAASFSGLLKAIGWPGDGSPNSAEYQTMEVWNELLSEFAGLDGVSGPVRLDAAVGVLRRLASSRQFQPESDPAPVQILGIFETAGLAFDRLWIMGMDDGVWPPPPSPDPFLPFRLQRRLNLPRSSPERELEFANLMTRRLLASAPRVIVSHPQRDADSDLRVSPLFRSLPEGQCGELGLVTSAGYAQRLQESSRMETLEDHQGPPYINDALGGGTSLFKLQSECPFKAFAQLRLAAKAPGQAEAGLSAMDRGQLVHSVLERVWDSLGSHEALVSTTDERLAALVRTTVSAGIRELSERRRALRRKFFAEIEQERLERVVTEWLSLEKERESFTVVERENDRRVTVGGIEVRIRMDRVDRLPDGGLVILDYKTGECSPSDWEGDRPDQPQLPIYAATADSPVAGVLFGRLKTGKVAFTGLTDSEGVAPGVNPLRDMSLEDRIDDWHRVLDRLGADFREGRAAVNPKDCRTNCEYCHLRTLCRIHQADLSVDLGSEAANG